MSDKPKPKILTRLRIDEVSAVDAGAGKGVKVMLMKRAGDSAYDPEPLTAAEYNRAQYAGREALRHQEEMEAREKRDRDDEDRKLYYDLVTGRTSVVDIYGVKKGDDEDEATPVDKHVSVSTKDKSITFDIGDKTITARDQRALARWLAIQERIQCVHKSNSPEDNTTMDYKTKLHDMAKRHGITAIAKALVEDNNAFGISEHELTELVTAQAKRDNPGLSPAQAFTKMYAEQSEAGTILRRAFQVCKNSAYQADTADADDAAAAYAELEAIGKRDYPNLPKHVQFAKAFEAHPSLAARAHRRPGPSTSFAHPVAKALPLVNVDGVTLDPQYTTETDPNAAEKALAQLRALGRQKWPTLSEAQSFINAVSDPENADLVTVATRTPKGSSPGRQ